MKKSGLQRILSCILCLIMIAGIMPMSVFATTPQGLVNLALKEGTTA